MHIEVRLAEKDDIKMMNGILSEMERCDIESRTRRFNEAVESNLSSYLLAVSDDKVIGFINIWHIPDIVDGEALGLILDCYVSGEFRSHGVGKMLLEAALDMGSKYKVNKYYAWMAKDNKPAVSILKKFGFSEESLMLGKK